MMRCNLLTLAAGALSLACAGPGNGGATPAAAATSTGLAAPATATTDGSVRVNEFLSYRADKHVVQLRLVAGYNASNNTLNFNGATEGAHTVTIPVGWRVEAVVENHGDLPHSAVVLAATPKLPETPSAAAFPGARTDHSMQGAGKRTMTPLSFVAAQPGAFQIVCGVPYHSQAGMWIKLVVSGQAKAPGYATQRRG